MRITKKMIQAAEEAGACTQALRWLRRRPRTVEQLVAYPEYGYNWLYWALSSRGRGIFTKEQHKEARRIIEEQEYKIWLS